MKGKIDFQDGHYGSYVIFPIRMILASYQVLSQLAQGCRGSRILKQIVDVPWRKTQDGWHMKDIVLRWAKNMSNQLLLILCSEVIYIYIYEGSSISS